jgi:hypothetical protein
MDTEWFMFTSREAGVLVFETKGERKVGKSFLLLILFSPLLPATFLHFLYTPMMSCRLSRNVMFHMEVW